MQLSYVHINEYFNENFRNERKSLVELSGVRRKIPFRIQGVPMNNLAPMRNCPGGAR